MAVTRYVISRTREALLTGERYGSAAQAVRVARFTWGDVGYLIARVEEVEVAPGVVVEVLAAVEEIPARGEVVA